MSNLPSSLQFVEDMEVMDWMTTCSWTQSQTESSQSYVCALRYSLKYPCGFPAIDNMLFCVNIDFLSPSTPLSF